MPRKKDSNANGRQLEKQVAELKKQLGASKKELANSKAKHAQALKEAADIGYEMGCIEAEEHEISRAKVVAEAIARFEKKYAKQSPKKQIVAKKSVAKVKAKPATAKKAVAKPATVAIVKPTAKSVKQRPAKPVQPIAPQEVEVADMVVNATEPTEVM